VGGATAAALYVPPKQLQIRRTKRGKKRDKESRAGEGKEKKKLRRAETHML
jgi:hypothetical protein